MDNMTNEDNEDKPDLFEQLMNQIDAVLASVGK